MQEKWDVASGASGQGFVAAGCGWLESLLLHQLDSLVAPRLGVQEDNEGRVVGEGEGLGQEAGVWGQNRGLEESWRTEYF